MDSPATSLNFSIARDLSAHSGADECFDLAKSWLKTCTRDHKVCSDLSPPPSPTRLIDVGLSSSIIKLIDAGKGFTEKYAALSHCWGGKVSLQTKKDSIDKFKKALNWDEMPKTFQDAVTVTRKLDIPFLWIDSLCIVQDSVTDWEIESAKMADVYGGAYVTIAAVSSSNGATAFLSPRDHIGTRQHNIEVEFDGGKPGIVKTRRTTHLDCIDGDWNREAEKIVPSGDLGGPLNTRAWAFQEQQLSTRILYFEEAELRWECRTAAFCECQVRPQPMTRIPFLYGTRNEDQHDFTGSKNIWHRVVELYSKRKLTYPSDIFPALSGIAAVNQKLSDSLYVAGLWQNPEDETNLIFDLLWRVPLMEYEELKSHRQVEPCRAPTFSWASVDGEILYPEFYKTQDIIYDSSVDFAETECQGNGAPFGAVNNGLILLNGPLVKATVSQNEEYDASSNYWVLERNGASCEMIPDTPLFLIESLTSKGEKKQVAHRALPGEACTRPSNFPVWCLPLWHRDKIMFGLVLAPSRTKEDMYERLGLMTWDVIAGMKRGDHDLIGKWFDGVDNSLVCIV
jgi:hypothetical protein